MAGVNVHTLHLINLGEGTALDVPLDDDWIGALFLTPTGDTLARVVTNKEGKELQFYDCATGRLLAKHLSKELLVDEVTDEAVVFRTCTPPASGWDLEIWSVPERRLLACLPDAAAPINSDDGKFLLVQQADLNGNASGSWRVWSMQEQRIVTEFQTEKWIDAPPVISPDNRWLATLLTPPGPGQGRKILLSYASSLRVGLSRSLLGTCAHACVSRPIADG